LSSSRGKSPGRGPAYLALLGEHVRVDRVAPNVGRGGDQAADQGRVLDRGQQSHPAAERVAHDVGLVQPEMVDERGNVIGHEPDVDRPVDVGRPAVSLQVGGDDLVPLGERGKDRPEHLTGPEATVQQDQRPPRAVRFVIELEAVHLGVVSGALHAG